MIKSKIGEASLNDLIIKILLWVAVFALILIGLYAFFKRMGIW